MTENFWVDLTCFVLKWGNFCKTHQNVSFNFKIENSPKFDFSPFSAEKLNFDHLWFKESQVCCGRGLVHAIPSPPRRSQTQLHPRRLLLSACESFGTALWSDVQKVGFKCQRFGRFARQARTLPDWDVLESQDKLPVNLPITQSDGQGAERWSGGRRYRTGGDWLNRRVKHSPEKLSKWKQQEEIEKSGKQSGKAWHSNEVR